MHWLDNVVALPTWGLRIEPNFCAASHYHEIFAPLMQSFQEEYGTVTISEPAFGNLQISSDNHSRIYKLSIQDLIVDFKYLAKKKKSRDLTPYYEDIEVYPYTNLLDKEKEDLIELISYFESEGGITVKRIGVVATTNLLTESMPPGINTLIEHLESFWKGDLIKSSTVLTPIIYSDDFIEERCHYTIEFDKTEKPDEITVILDWQQTLKKTMKILDKKSCSELLDNCKAKALEYFEKVATGDFIDDDSGE